MLKRKIEVNYRKAVVKVDGHHRNCKGCAHRQMMNIKSCAFPETAENTVIRQDWRCDVIGLQNSRKYSVAADHICDCFEA